MDNDPFSDILKLVKTESLVTGGLTAGGAWAIRFPAPDKIKFFAVVKGHCWVSLEGEPAPLLARTGDVMLLTAKRSFVLASDLAVTPLDAMTLFRGNPGNLARLGESEDFCHIGGHVLLDATSGKLLEDVLPPWIHVHAGSPQATVMQWLVDQLLHERASDLPAAQFVSEQLAQLLFVQILRAHLDVAGPACGGWLRALGDRRIAPALRLMHQQPARAWYLEELADAVAMSRTTFAVRFKQVVGVAPLAYLAQWRMRLAERALRSSSISVAALAESLGYASESAFSNAFKRITGASPRHYRFGVRPAEVLAS